MHQKIYKYLKWIHWDWIEATLECFQTQKNNNEGRLYYQNESRAKRISGGNMAKRRLFPNRKKAHHCPATIWYAFSPGLAQNTVLKASSCADVRKRKARFPTHKFIWSILKNAWLYFFFFLKFFFKQPFKKSPNKRAGDLRGSSHSHQKPPADAGPDAWRKLFNSVARPGRQNGKFLPGWTI